MYLNNPLLPLSIQVSPPQVKNILLLDSEGKRVAVKYFCDDWSTLAAKMTFEKSLFTKTQRTSARAEGKVPVASNEWVEGDLLGTYIPLQFLPNFNEHCFSSKYSFTKPVLNSI
jgi:hypothetical protein